jgi:LPXTG-site transpeptidase (sortase) family protein
MKGTGWRRGAAAAAAALLAGLLGYALTAPAPGDPTTVLAVPATTATSAAASTPSTSPGAMHSPPSAVGPSRHSAALVPARPGSVPTAIRIPRLDVGAPIIPVGVDASGQVAVPPDIRTAGWYRFGARPRQGEGPTVVVAHVDSRAQGVGPFAALRSLRSGDRIEVTAGGVVIAYRVRTVARIAKSQLDTRLLFAADGPERLHLVTCGGPFDEATHSYEDNVIVVALPVGVDASG